MNSRRALFTLRVVALLALGVSSALLVDYLRAVPAFCAVGSGCDQVRKSAGFVGKVPIPAFGVAGFLSLVVLSVVPSAMAQRLAAFGAMAGSVTGVALIAAQGVVVGAFCSLCVTVDLLAIACGTAGAFSLRRGWQDAFLVRRPLVWSGLTVAVMGLPFGLSEARPPPAIPRNIASLASPNAVTLVEFTDFECPFCRLAHPRIEEAKLSTKRPIVVVRKMYPLTKIHLHARVAALAYLCGVAQGMGEAVADKLFLSDDLTAAGCEKAALATDIDAEKFRTCVKDPRTDQQVEVDMDFVREGGFEGLPTVWIDGEKVIGAAEREVYAALFAGAVPDKPAPAPSYAALAVVLLASLGLILWGSLPSSSAEPA